MALGGSKHLISLPRLQRNNEVRVKCVFLSLNLFRVCTRKARGVGEGE
jgi:hypothetical protein